MPLTEPANETGVSEVYVQTYPAAAP